MSSPKRAVIRRVGGSVGMTTGVALRKTVQRLDGTLSRGQPHYAHSETDLLEEHGSNGLHGFLGALVEPVAGTAGRGCTRDDHLVG